MRAPRRPRGARPCDVLIARGMVRHICTIASPTGATARLFGSGTTPMPHAGYRTLVLRFHGVCSVGGVAVGVGGRGGRTLRRNVWFHSRRRSGCLIPGPALHEQVRGMVPTAPALLWVFIDALARLVD